MNFTLETANASDIKFRVHLGATIEHNGNKFFILGHTDYFMLTAPNGQSARLPNMRAVKDRIRAWTPAKLWA